MLLQEKHAGEIAQLRNEMHSNHKNWKDEKAKMESVTREADKKHQQLADRTALVYSRLAQIALLYSCTLADT